MIFGRCSLLLLVLWLSFRSAAEESAVAFLTHPNPIISTEAEHSLTVRGLDGEIPTFFLCSFLCFASAPALALRFCI
jgi:hypothetical protein